MESHTVWSETMAFPDRLATIRKQKGLTQQELADRSGVSVVQIRRYEGGSSQPTMDHIRNLAVTLGITTDFLIFEKDERGPDDDLRLQFEALSRFSDEEKQTAKALLEGLILRHEAKRWAAS